MKSQNFFIFTVSLLLSLFFVFNCGQGAKESESTHLEIGKVYYGFKFVKEKKIIEYDAVGKLFHHEKSGARLLKVVAKDDNKTFCIAFKYWVK